MLKLGGILIPFTSLLNNCSVKRIFHSKLPRTYGYMAAIWPSLFQVLDKEKKTLCEFDGHWVRKKKIKKNLAGTDYFPSREPLSHWKTRSLSSMLVTANTLLVALMVKSQGRYYCIFFFISSRDVTIIISLSFTHFSGGMGISSSFRFSFFFFSFVGFDGNPRHVSGYVVISY